MTEAAFLDKSYWAPEWLLRSCWRKIIVYVSLGLSDSEDPGIYSVQYLHQLPLPELYPLLQLGMDRLADLIERHGPLDWNEQEIEKSFDWMNQYLSNIESYWAAEQPEARTAAGPQG